MSTHPLEYLLDDGKTQPNSIAVDCSCPFELSKLLEQFRDVLCLDASACILNMDDKRSDGEVVACFQVDSTALRELQSILQQVDDDLLETSYIAEQLWQTIAQYLPRLFLDQSKEG